LLDLLAFEIAVRVIFVRLADSSVSGSKPPAASICITSDVPERGSPLALVIKPRRPLRRGGTGDAPAQILEPSGAPSQTPGLPAGNAAAGSSHCEFSTALARDWNCP
jgi:hypothetical protein